MAGESKTARQATAAGQLGKATKIKVDPLAENIRGCLKLHYGSYGLLHVRSNPHDAAVKIMNGLDDWQVNLFEDRIVQDRPFSVEDLVETVRDVLTYQRLVLTAEALAEKLDKTVDYVRKHASSLGGEKVDGKWTFTVLTNGGEVMPL